MLQMMDMRLSTLSLLSSSLAACCLLAQLIIFLERRCRDIIEFVSNLAFCIFEKKCLRLFLNKLLMITSNLMKTLDMPNEKTRCAHMMYILLLLHMSSFYLLHLKRLMSKNPFISSAHKLTSSIIRVCNPHHI